MKLILLFTLLSAQAGADCRDVKLVFPLPETAMIFVIFHHPGPKWDKDVGCFEQPLLNEHKAYFTEANKAKVSQGGPFNDCTGGMVILKRGLTLDEACTLAERDPAVLGGTLTSDVHPWLDVMPK